LQEDKEHEHDSSISSVGIEREGLCDMGLLQQWLGALLRDKGADLFRSKGVLAMHGSNDRCEGFRLRVMHCELGKHAEAHQVLIMHFNARVLAAAGARCYVSRPDVIVIANSCVQLRHCSSHLYCCITPTVLYLVAAAAAAAGTCSKVCTC
jgi:hypothetical protein